MASKDILLEVKGLKKYFAVEKGFMRKTVGYVKAVDDVSIFVREGETLGLVGESGCGKTTLGRCILRGIEPTAGSVLFRTPDGEMVDIIKLNKKDMRAMRRHMQMIFQDPYASLDPRMTVFDIIREPIWASKLASGREMENRVLHIAEVVGLNVRHLRRYPHAFSGGQRQRIGIARALATNPRLIIADEPVSALDVSIQSQILNLLQDLQAEFNLTYVFVAHNLGVIEHISDRVAVMYVGKMVETAATEEMFLNPKHPYTEALLSAVPKPNPELRMDRIMLSGEIANPANPPSGCYFHPRCRYAQERCKVETPAWREVTPEHFVACHFADEIKLAGVPAEMVSLWLIVFLEIAAIVLVVGLSAVLLNAVTDRAVGSKHRAAQIIVETGKIPPQWIRRRAGGAATSDASGRARSAALKKLDGLIAYFKTSRLVENEDTREVLLSELNQARQRWQERPWHEIS